MQGTQLLRPGAGKKEAGEKKALQKTLRWGRATLPMTGAFFLLSIAQCFSMPSPYALCCLWAVLAVKLPAEGAAVGLLVGMAFRLAWGLPLDAWQFLSCALAFFAIRLHIRTEKQWYILGGALLLLRAAPHAAAAQNTQGILMAFGGWALGMVTLPALRRVAALLRKQQKEMSQDDLLCLLLPLLFLVSGAARLSAFQMNLGYLFSVLAVLGLSWIAGGAAGMCAGLGCGLALLLGGQGALMLVNLTFGALVAGLFQGKNRLLSTGVFLLSAVTLTYLIAYSFQPVLFFAAVSGSLIFCLWPRKGLRRMARWVRSLSFGPPRDNAYTRLKMQRWVRSIDRMAEALPHPRMEQPSPQEESEALMEGLCTGCDQLPICWHEKFEESREGMAALAHRGDDPERYLPLINRYFSACPRISRIPPLLTRLDEEHQRRAHRALCAEYEREMLQTHLTALSQEAQRISLEGMVEDGEESYDLAQADEAIEAMAFPGKTAFVKRVDQRMTVCVACEPLSLRPAAGERLAQQIGTYLNVNLKVTEQKNGRIILEEQPPLRVQTGVATACAVSLERKRRPGQKPDNGDAVLARFLSGGKWLLALSDGMGHGAGAQDESKKTLEMLSLCMEAGYTRAQAATAVNGAMLSATGGEKFATVDLCLIDLWTGDAAMNKLGACASILLQGQKSRWIEGEALPLGIIEHVAPTECCFRVAEGDVLLMMSDGIADAFRDQEDMLSLVQQHRMDPPQRLADALLQEAILRRDGLPPDDMTVLCARIRGRKEAV